VIIKLAAQLRYIDRRCRYVTIIQRPESTKGGYPRFKRLFGVGRESFFFIWAPGRAIHSYACKALGAWPALRLPQCRYTFLSLAQLAGKLKNETPNYEVPFVLTHGWAGFTRPYLMRGR
jgi:hypothetical protein